MRHFKTYRKAADAIKRLPFRWQACAQGVPVVGDTEVPVWGIQLHPYGPYLGECDPEDHVCSWCAPRSVV